MDVVFCFLVCEANSWHRRAGSNPGDEVCVSFFSFFPFLAVLAFFMIKRTHAQKQGRCEAMRKGRKEIERFIMMLCTDFLKLIEKTFRCCLSMDVIH